MLQIISGKFFKNTTEESLHITPYSDIIYSNINIANTIETDLFTIEPIYTNKEINTYLIRYENKIEKQNNPKVELNSVGHYQIVNDILVCLTFWFKGIFTIDKNYLETLLRDKGETTVDIIYPKKVLPTLFKNSLNYISDDEINSFKHFSEDLIKLKRDEYKKIIMAMRQYYNSIFLVNLNIDLAYTSFVAIIESLTQKLDEYTPIWEDYPEKARKSLDKVLQRLEENDSEEIKNLLLEYSHNKLASRYFNFCKDAVELDYYMEYAMDIKYPCTHIEIEDAIRNSYKVRSKYIHELENLPIEFTWNYEREICSIKGKSYFTFEGIVRFIRYLIIKLVNKLEKVSKENIDYFDELPGTHTASLIDDFAPQHWISNEQLYNIELSVSYLNGLLSIISSGRFEKEKRLPNLVGVCDKVEKLLKGINNNEKKQLPLIMLYAVYNKLVVEESRSKNYVNVIEKYRDLIEKPSIESLSYYLVSGNYIPWGIEKIIEIYDAYEKTRNKKGSIELGGTNETILLTTIINNYSEIDEDLYKKYLSKLVGIHPGNKYISSIFNNFVENQNMGKIQLEKIYGI